MPITPHANGKPLLKRNSSFPTFNDSACCLVCEQRSDSSALTSKANSNLLNDRTYQYILCGELCHPSGQTEQGAHYIRNDLLD